MTSFGGGLLFIAKNKATVFRRFGRVFILQLLDLPHTSGKSNAGEAGTWRSRVQTTRPHSSRNLPRVYEGQVYMYKREVKAVGSDRENDMTLVDIWASRTGIERNIILVKISTDYRWSFWALRCDLFPFVMREGKNKKIEWRWRKRRGRRKGRAREKEQKESRQIAEGLQKQRQCIG